jgi:hypothetical protein
MFWARAGTVASASALAVSQRNLFTFHSPMKDADPRLQQMATRLKMVAIGY